MMQGTQTYNDINYMRIFTHRKLLITLITAVTAAISVGFAKYKIPTYTATATLIIAFDDPTANNSSLPAMLQEEYMSTQIGIASGNFMAEQVYNSLDFEIDPIFNDIRTSLQQENLNSKNLQSFVREWMLKRVRVYVHNKSTRLMKIAFNDKDRNIAIKIANAFADQYLKTALELNLAPIRSSVAWIDENAKPILETLKTAEGVLEGGATEDDIDLIENSLYAAQSGLNTLESMLNKRGTDARVERNSQYLVEVRSALLTANQKLIEKSRTVGVRNIEYEAARTEVEYLKNVFLAEVKKQIDSIRVAIDSLQQSLILRSSVKESNVKLLNYAHVEVDSDSVSIKKAALYGAFLGFMLAILIAFFSILGRPDSVLQESID